MLEMSVINKKATMIQFFICSIPNNEVLYWNFENNKKFGDLKNDLQERHKIMKGTYHFEVDGKIMDDDAFLEDSGIIYNSCINIVNNNCIKIKIEVKDYQCKIQIIEKYLLISDFKVIKSDENKVVKNNEIKLLIDLLKDETKDHLSILQDLNYLYDNLDNETYLINEMFLEMGFLSSVREIFENEKDGDEKIINLLVIIIKKLSDTKFIKEGKNLYKSKDAINPLFSFMLKYSDNEVKEDAINIIITIAKKYPSDVMNCDRIKNCYKDILPSNKEYSDNQKTIDGEVFSLIHKRCPEEKKSSIYILFKEMIKEGIIRKGEYGSEIIEEILFIAEMINEKKDIINVKEDAINIISDYIIIAKEKGFDGKLFKNKNEIIEDSFYLEWIEICKEKDNISDESSERIKEEEVEKIKKFSDYVTSHSFDIQIKFINKLNPDSYYFNSRKNGLFLYYYLPLLFEIYHFEEIFPKFLLKIKDKFKCIHFCFEYIIKLYNEIIERIMKESEGLEIKEENIIILMFLWSVIKEEGRKENEIGFLINLTVKLLNWLGSISEVNEEEIKEREKEKIKKGDDKEEGAERNINRKDTIMFCLIRIITFNLCYNEKDEESVKKDGRIGELLLEIVKNHLKYERCLIQEGNKKRIIEYIIYSYYDNLLNSNNEDVDTSNLLSAPSHSYPFSHNTITFILDNIYKCFTDDDEKELIKKDVLEVVLELLNNYINIIEMLFECDVEKEIERELLIEWNDNILNKLFKKISLLFFCIKDAVYPYLQSCGFYSFDSQNNNIIKRYSFLFFNHCHNIINSNREEKEKNNKDVEMITVNSFISNVNNRKFILNWLIYPFTNKLYYSIFDIYYLVNKSEVEYGLYNILAKELSGEIVDRIKWRVVNNNKNVRKERRRYERERTDFMHEILLKLLENTIENTFKDRSNDYLGSKRNKDEYEGKEKEIKEYKDYISDIIEEEDMRECLILYLNHTTEIYNSFKFKYELQFSDFSSYSNNSLYYLLSLNNLKEEKRHWYLR